MEGAKLKYPHELCSCIPKWLKDVSPEVIDMPQCTLVGSSCKGCGAFINASLMNMTVVAYTCMKGISTGRIHFIGTAYCGKKECVQKLKDSLKQREKLVEFMEYPFALERVDSKGILERHAQTTSACAHCHTGEQSKFKFPVCSRCLQVRYCDAECQNADHSKHKVWCKQKALDMAIAKPTAIPDVPWCDCYDEEARRIHHHASNSLCCAPKCDKPIGGRISAVGFYMTQCTKNRGAMHLMPECFCSDRCRKRLMNSKKKK